MRWPDTNIFLSAVLALVCGCTGIPDGLEPVQPFDLNGYLGKWYEIARGDHRFERGLECVRATYSLRDDGLIRVQNRGYNVAEGAWSEAVGRADFVDSPRVGRLKVSFFGPFWGGYNLVRYDPERGLALVVGPKLDWVWILSRTPSPSTDDLLLAESWLRAVGVDPESLHWTKHDPGVCAEGGSPE